MSGIIPLFDITVTYTFVSKVKFKIGRTPDTPNHLPIFSSRLFLFPLKLAAAPSPPFCVLVSTLVAPLNRQNTMKRIFR